MSDEQKVLDDLYGENAEEVMIARTAVDIDRYATWTSTKWNGRGIYTQLSPALAQQLCNALIGQMGESGELADIIKKLVFHNMEYTEGVKLALKKELGDQFYYLSRLCGLLDVWPTWVLEANIRKLEARFPEGFDDNRANNKDESKEG